MVGCHLLNTPLLMKYRYHMSIAIFGRYRIGTEIVISTHPYRDLPRPVTESQIRSVV